MEQPIPLDISKLGGILANAKKIMQKVDAEKPIKQAKKPVMYEEYSDNSNTYSEADERELLYETNGSVSIENDPKRFRDYTDDDLRNSKLPSSIKKIMGEHHIPKNTQNVFSKLPNNFDNIPGLVDKPIKQQRSLNEVTQQSNNRFNFTIEDINELIDKKVEEVISKRLNEEIAKFLTKTLTEQTIKKTVSILTKAKTPIKK